MVMSSSREVIKLAAEAYKAYSKHTGGRSLATGDPLPLWEELPIEIQDAWRASTEAVLRGVVANIEGGFW